MKPVFTTGYRRPAKALGRAHFMSIWDGRGNGISLSAPGGGEGRGEVGDSRSSQRPTSPSHAGACPRAALCADPWGVGPSLSPLKGGEGFLMGRARSVHALARKRGSEPASSFWSAAKRADHRAHCLKIADVAGHPPRQKRPAHRSVRRDRAWGTGCECLAAETIARSRKGPGS